MISWLHPSQLIHCDTDSAYFLYDKTNPDHQLPNNNSDPTLPDNVRFGDGLGCWKDELGSDLIKEMVVGGAKSYAYQKFSGKTTIAMKGITLDCANSALVHFDKIKDMVIIDGSIDTAKRYQFIWCKETKQIKTIFMSRKIRSTLNTKRTVTNNDTLPYGFQN